MTEKAIVDGRDIEYDIVGKHTPGVIPIAVPDLKDPTEIFFALREYIRRAFWFASKEFYMEELYDRMQIKLSELHAVDLFCFGRTVPRALAHQIADALGQFYGRLRDPAMWKLDSIQIRTRDLEDSYGSLRYGRAFPREHRFELFPASFERGNYRDLLPCSWLTGSTLHQTALVCLDHRDEDSAVGLAQSVVSYLQLGVPGLDPEVAGALASIFKEEGAISPTVRAKGVGLPEVPKLMVHFYLDPEATRESRQPPMPTSRPPSHFPKRAGYMH